MQDRKERTEGRGLFDLDLKHPYLSFRRTKIVATIGPSSSSPEMLKQLMMKGMDTARINFSHGAPGSHPCCRKCLAKRGGIL